MGGTRDRFEAWLDALEARHLAHLTFPEVRRALQALSSLYVERRSRISSGVALDGAGKRAAFALFYGPLHYLAVLEAVRVLGGAQPPPRRIADLGCGTGPAGAAWAVACGGSPILEGVDRNAWAVTETRWTWRTLGLDGTVRTGGLERFRLDADAVVAAYAVNELPPEDRDLLRSRLEDAAGRGARVLVVEPLARSATPWWGEWAASFRARGGRADEWRFSPELPPLLSRLDRAAGLDHREIGARTLWRGPLY